MVRGWFRHIYMSETLATLTASYAGHFKSLSQALAEEKRLMRLEPGSVNWNLSSLVTRSSSQALIILLRLSFYYMQMINLQLGPLSKKH